MNLPSIRDPKSFYDVFTITISAILLMALILHVANSRFVRIEAIAFVALVFLWDFWAIERILARSESQTSRL